MIILSEAPFFEILRDNSASFANGMNTSELIRWWGRGVIEGSDVYEAFNNYRTIGHLHLVVENDLDTSRFQINHILDFDDLKNKVQAEIQPRLGN